jgi:hypothetical protein
LTLPDASRVTSAPAAVWLKLIGGFLPLLLARR